MAPHATVIEPGPVKESDHLAQSEPKFRIRARHTADTVTVYQAYSPRIGGPAARHGRFPAAWKRDRMTWVIKPRSQPAGARRDGASRVIRSSAVQRRRTNHRRPTPGKQVCSAVPLMPPTAGRPDHGRPGPWPTARRTWQTGGIHLTGTLW
ncbi:hypothetical protein SBD_1236 [Streptomyces bottropensis ATCC 25435]|uniref:DUF4291 domain-containing protein n=1 Tax=Streptomyces bottropensis ATCC 25435 TaxID=1054862 RepID=M3G1S5_9ACTN|nr:hypothetical protein SBD_1236 [Streptomyces bottropensis ATCC 25435]